MPHVVRVIVRYPAAMAVLSVLAVALPWWWVRSARIDNSIEVWMDRHSDDFRRYEAFRGRYGSDEMIIVAAAMQDPFAPPALAAQRELAERLRAIEGIQGVTSLPEAHTALLLRAPDDGTPASQHALVRNLLLSEDCRTVGLIAWLRPTPGPGERHRVVNSVREASAVMDVRGYTTHLVGTPVLNAALDRASSDEAARLLPVAAAVSVVMLLALFRSISGPVVCVLATAATILWTIAGMVMVGSSFNLISVALPSLVMVLSIPPAMHIAVRYTGYLGRGRRPRVAMRRTLQELMLPLILTTATTAIGFASLMFTSMQPVFEMGLFAAIGVALSLLFALIMVPSFLRMLPAPRSAASPVAEPRRHWTVVASLYAASRPGLVVLLSLILVPLLALVTLRIRMETNVLRFLPSDSRIAEDYRFVTDRLTGVYTLEVDVAVPARDESSARDAITRLARSIEQHPDVARTSYYDQFSPLLVGPGQLALLSDAIDPVKRAAAHFRVVSADAVHLRLSVLVRSMVSTDFESIIAAARERAAQVMPATAKWGLTGAVLLMNNEQAGLVKAQIQSFLVASVLILGLIGALMRSWRIVAAAIVPNLLPVLAILALMSLRSISLNPATVMIASIAIGLAVDGTIHFLSSYRSAGASLDPVSAVGAAMELSGRPIVFAALVAAAGFMLLAAARFAPLREFGLLTGVTLVIAMLCAVLITPAWAVLCRVREDSNAVTDS